MVDNIQQTSALAAVLYLACYAWLSWAFGYKYLLSQSLVIYRVHYLIAVIFSLRGAWAICLKHTYFTLHLLPCIAHGEAHRP